MPRNLADIETLTNNIIEFLHKDVLLGSLNDNNIEYKICFDCELWNNGFTVIKPISGTFVDILRKIEIFICNQLSDQQLNNFGFKSQLDRFLGIICNLKNKILAIRCIDICNDSTNITSHLLYTLIQTLLMLVTILENINASIAYMDTCCCSTAIVFDLLMGKVINSITDIQMLLKDWYSIVMTFLHYSTISTKSYIASYVPKHPIMPPPCPPKPSPSNCTTYPY